MRWIWIDRFTAFEPGKSAQATKCLSLAEDFFADHFPGYPVMPAALILEGLAQTGGILVGDASDFREKVVLAKVHWARFPAEAVAGDELIYDVELLQLRQEGALVRGSTRVGATTVAEAEIFFAHLDQARSRTIFGEHNFVFTGELQRVLKLTKTLANRPDGKATAVPPA